MPNNTLWWVQNGLGNSLIAGSSHIRLFNSQSQAPSVTIINGNTRARRTPIYSAGTYWGYGGIYLSQKVDLTDFTEIVFVVSADSYNAIDYWDVGIGAFIGSSINGEQLTEQSLNHIVRNGVGTSAPMGEYVVTIDKNATQECFVGIEFMVTSNSTDAYVQSTIQGIYLR